MAKKKPKPDPTPNPRLNPNPPFFEDAPAATPMEPQGPDYKGPPVPDRERPPNIDPYEREP